MAKIKDLIKAGRDQASLKLRDQEEEDRVKVAAMERHSSSLWDRVAKLWQNDGISETGPTNNITASTASQHARKKSRRRMQRESRRRNRR